MPVQIIRAARALTPTEEIIDAAVVIEDGIITAVGRREEIIPPKSAKKPDAPIHIFVPRCVALPIHGACAPGVKGATPAARGILANTVSRDLTPPPVGTTV